MSTFNNFALSFIYNFEKRKSTISIDSTSLLGICEFSKSGILEKRVTWFPRTSVVPIKFIINHKSDVKREEKKKKASEREQVKEKERERGGPCGISKNVA